MKSRVARRRKEKLSAYVALALVCLSIGYVSKMDYQDQRAKTEGALAYYTP